MRIWWTLLFVASCSGPQTETRRSMPTPGHLSSEVRATLGARMQGHGDDMNDLLWSILFLDFASTTDIASHIAAQSPLPTASEVPPEILALESQLHALAGELEVAAKAEDSAKVAQIYGSVAETCVRCHASYLSEPPSPPEQVQGGEPPS